MSATKRPLVEYDAPPPGYRQSPVTPGSAYSSRIALPPPAWRCMPIVQRMPVGRVVAIRRPSSTIRSSGRPVSAATRSGGNSRMRSRNASQPTVCVREVLAVLRAHVDDHPQQPERERGVGARERRQVLVGALGRARAQRVDRDDVRAALARREHELPQVVAARERVRAPQQDQVGLGERLRVHPGRGPGRVAGAPASPPPSRPSSGGATRRARSTAAARRGPPAPGCSRACRCPGTARSPRRRTPSRTSCSRSAISASASSHEIRSKRPSPFAPTRRSGCSSRSGARA